MNFGRLIAGASLSALWSFVGNGAWAHPSAMVTGNFTSQPIGHFEFCKRNTSECTLRSRKTAPLPMSSEFLAQLQQLNVSVNKAIKPISDFDLYGVEEYWTYPVDAGDCEDYVLAKRRVLIEDGIPSSTVLITVLRRPNGEGHAVLTVRTDIGDVILDNLTDAVLNWDETGYTYLKRQAVDHTGRWVSIRDGDAPLVGSVH
ncbi:MULTISPECIES: transglutaminase-like cysteine peptidase [Shinella]|uniref:Transglutaminase n=1 Tax=Shinella zoogloeoides TaxID=352475 RepID=A0A6N8TFA9_SHIZO|nr:MULTISPECIES: transglutaminase-like cysteine peptidase [Shinella]MBP8938575.1 transglutaminase-like cysteine peptidase [Agrobacterium sp.]EYR82729.1 transglutaminase-like cysteine peptidase, BTLCP [Shinella sp. DD12]MCW5712063.1 transglutaminase-like cysteine peptidase [Shinella sp.]MXO01932.1 transglutaminase [Shinella zoogloeoides]TAA51328.1 transglutaminase [Shinella sp. JR1-6]